MQVINEVILSGVFLDNVEKKGVEGSLGVLLPDECSEIL